MWYKLRDDTIVMNTTVSRVKGHNLARDRRISICVADGYRYVTISGEANFAMNGTSRSEDIHHIAIRYHGEEKTALQMAEQFSQQTAYRSICRLSAPSRMGLNRL